DLFQAGSRLELENFDGKRRHSLIRYAQNSPSRRERGKRPKSREIILLLIVSIASRTLPVRLPAGYAALDRLAALPPGRYTEAHILRWDSLPARTYARGRRS